jgi:chaperone modulatory protein CbpM
MIITRLEFLARARLDEATLEIWIKEEWLVPEGAGAEPAFTETDLARAQLIRDLVEDLGVNSEGVGVILHLLDQMHGMRSAMTGLVETAQEPKPRLKIRNARRNFLPSQRLCLSQPAARNADHEPAPLPCGDVD